MLRPSVIMQFSYLDVFFHVFTRRHCFRVTKVGPPAPGDKESEDTRTVVMVVTICSTAETNLREV